MDMREAKFSGSKTRWILTGAVLITLVAGGFLTPSLLTEGVEFSPKEVKAYHDASFTREAKWARSGETLHIRAVNSTSGSTPSAGDYLYLYVNSTSNATGFALNLTYQSDYYFTCNLTLGNTTNSTAGNYTIEVAHGDSVYLRNNTNRSVIYYTIKIDNQPPQLDVDVDGWGFVDQDRIYLLKDDVIRLSPSDTDSGVHTTMYSWDGGSYSEYNETTGIKAPAAAGRHILRVTVEDEATNVANFTYTAWTSINWTAGRVILSNETLSYTNATIFAGNLTILGSLRLRNCNLIFVGVERRLEVLDGGFLGITDYDGSSSTEGDISRLLPSPGSSFTISYLAGSKGWMNSTEIRDAGVSGRAIYVATSLDMVHVKAHLRGEVMLDGGQVRVESSHFEVLEGERGLYYEGHHRTFSSPLYIGNSTLSGSTPYGLIMKNLSVERASSTLRYSGFTSGENRTLSYVNTFGTGETLRFSYIFPEPGGARGALIASSDLLNWVTLYNITPTTEWRAVELNMSAYATQNLELRFYFNAPVNYSGSGYYITDPVIITPSSGIGIIPFSGNFTAVPSTLKACRINNMSVSAGERVSAAFVSSYATDVNGLHVDGRETGAVELLNLTLGDVNVRDSTLEGSPTKTLYGLTVVGNPKSTFDLVRCRISDADKDEGYLVRMFGGNVVLEECALNGSQEGIHLMDGSLRLLGTSIYNTTGTGLMVVAPSSDYRPSGRTPVEVKDSGFFNIGSSAILLVAPPYAEGGGVRINNTFLVNISSEKQEPVVIWQDPSITSFRTVIEDLTIRDSRGALNISSPVGADITGLTIANSSGPGVRVGGGGVFNITRLDENGVSSGALYLEKDTTLNLVTAAILNTGRGIVLEDSSTSSITGLTLNGSGGNGIWAGESSSLKVATSTITRCSGTGIVTEEGARVELLQVHVSLCDEGVILDDPLIKRIRNVWTQENSGDGFRLIMGDALYSHLGGGRLELVDGIHSIDNDGHGVRLIRSGSHTFTFVFKNFTVYGNLLPDLKADGGVRVYLQPVTASFDGARMQFNGRLEVMDTVYLLVRGLSIDFFGEDCAVLVESGGFLNLQGATIRSTTAGEPYTFEVYGGALLTNSYFGGVERIYVSGSDVFTMRGCRVDAVDEGLHILRSSFTVERTSVSGVDTGMTLISSIGTISDSEVTSNFVGIHLRDVGEGVNIEGTLIEGNVYGIRVESSGEYLVNISRCTFSNNEVSDLTVRGSTLTVYFSLIDVRKIAVLDSSSKVYVYYGVDLYLYNEVGGPLTADVVITDSGGVARYSSTIEGSELDIPLLAYTVTSSGSSSSHQPYTVTVTTSSGESAEEELTVTSHTVLGITINGAPVLISGMPTIYMNEDESAPGVLNLLDYVQDRDKLRFSVTGEEHIGAEVDDEGMLSLYPLVENWYGTETLSVRAEDTYGAYVEFTITVICQPVNDPPVLRNLTIIPRYPVTGDTLTASMVFYDVDGDPEPETILIQWYRNGEMVPRYSNQLQVPDVMAGERWYFEVRAWDGHSASENGYGELYRSEEVLVGNHPPVVNSVRIVERSPTTEEDLHVVVEDFYDPDSPVVEFRVQWQYLDEEQWVTLPVMGEALPSYYTSRGMSIRAIVSAFDGFGWSEAVATESVTVVNTPPVILEAVFEPERVLQTTQKIRVRVVECYDPDGDYIDYYYTWRINGREILSGYDNHTLSKDATSFSSGDIISCEIKPADPYGFGPGYTLETSVEPMDTDGDGLFDDYNGNGRNDGADDTDDDGDGYLDEWEEFMGTNPLDPSSKPTDTDGDGAPDGDSSNSQSWMDTDDDNDGFPDSNDDFPRLATEWKDTDRDGIGDNSDTDIDGDGIPNWKDYDPYDPSVWKAPVKKESKAFEYMITSLLLLLLLVILAGGYLLYTGKIKLPVQGEVKALGAPEAPRPSFGIPEEVEFEAEEELGEELEEEAEEEIEELEELVECGMCHELIPADSKVCPNCGAELVED